MPSADVTDELLKQVIEQLKGIRTEADERARKHSEQLSRHEVGLSKINETLEGHSAQLKAINVTLEAHTERFDSIDHRLQNLETDVKELGEQFVTLADVVGGLPQKIIDGLDVELAPARAVAGFIGTIAEFAHQLEDVRRRTTKLEQLALLPKPPDDKGEKS